MSQGWRARPLVGEARSERASPCPKSDLLLALAVLDAAGGPELAFERYSRGGASFAISATKRSSVRSESSSGAMRRSCTVIDPSA